IATVSFCIIPDHLSGQLDSVLSCGGLPWLVHHHGAAAGARSLAWNTLQRKPFAPPTPLAVTSPDRLISARGRRRPPLSLAVADPACGGGSTVSPAADERLRRLHHGGRR
ncbi:hypothetical protein U9M48_015641, partial [Paspalum notatum var. saurae]